MTLANSPHPFDRRDETGPFDIVGDVHGCCDELESLLDRLGYRVDWIEDGEDKTVAVTAPPGRRAVFVGDLVDRGPRSPDVLRIAMAMVEAGTAFAVPGNHDLKFHRWLSGRNLTLSHGLQQTVEQMVTEPPGFARRVKTFYEALATYLWLDGGALAVAHAGIKNQMLGRLDGRVGYFCIYGDTDGRTDADGLPIRYDWAAAEPAASTFVVYGHVPVAEPAWVNASVCIDTGCCFGGSLTALRWPESEIVSVPALRTYYPTVRRFGLPPPRPPAERQ